MSLLARGQTLSQEVNKILDLMKLNYTRTKIAEILNTSLSRMSRYLKYQFLIDIKDNIEAQEIYKIYQKQRKKNNYPKTRKPKTMTKKVNRPSGIHIHCYYLDKLAPQLIKLRRQGLSYEKISKELNIPKPSVHRYLTKHIFNHKTPKQQAELIELIHTPLPKEKKEKQKVIKKEKPKRYNKSNIIIKELIELIHTQLPKEEKIIQPKRYNKKDIIIKRVKID